MREKLDHVTKEYNMKVIEASNINSATSLGLSYLLESGIREQSRNGQVIVAPGPVCTVYAKPLERVLFSPTRDANPFFHLMEALWMLQGDNNISFPLMFNKRFSEYSDDGSTQWGAYGWRWRNFFDVDQIDYIVYELVKNPNSRRCVLSMWNPSPNQDNKPWYGKSDLSVAAFGGKDVPCNTHVYFDCRGGVLNMTVCNRSNDAIWGAYGANVVHFSVLQEYLATRIGVNVGVYRQVSNNFHAYTDVYSEEKISSIAKDAGPNNLYELYPMRIVPLMYENDTMFMETLEEFLASGSVTTKSENFFTLVAVPMYRAWVSRKEKGFAAAYEELSKMPTCDWQIAAVKWLKRREI